MAVQKVCILASILVVVMEVEWASTSVVVLGVELAELRDNDSVLILVDMKECEKALK
jgi:hypothetical protein